MFAVYNECWDGMDAQLVKQFLRRLLKKGRKRKVQVQAGTDSE